MHSDSTSTTNAQSATANISMIIPNKSTIAEEEIEVPYGRELRDSTGTAIDEREREREREKSAERNMNGGDDSDGEDDSMRSPGGLGGLAGLTARLQQAAENEEEDEGATSGAGGRSGDDYFDKMSFGRASVASDRSAGMGIGSRMLGRMSGMSLNGNGNGGGEDSEKIRSEYEYKVATMQTRIAKLERDLEDAHLREEKWAESDERARGMEAELEELRQVRYLSNRMERDEVHAMLITTLTAGGGR